MHFDRYGYFAVSLDAWVDTRRSRTNIFKLSFWMALSNIRTGKYDSQLTFFLKPVEQYAWFFDFSRPCTVFQNTLIQKAISVKKCFCLDANQAIVVYKNDKENECIKQVIHGPNMYALKPGEW